MVKEFNKSVSVTSTSSVESGIFDMEESYTAPPTMTIGATARAILMDAQKENRLISGLNNVSKYLNGSENPEHSLFFFIAPSMSGDSLNHMQEVCLQAFCFENDIYIIRLDSTAKLNKILGSKRADTCALVQRSAIKDLENADDGIDLDDLTDLENILVDHCEDFWNEPVQPVIRLPEK